MTFAIKTASQALKQIMKAEDSTEYRPTVSGGAEILLPDGEWLYVDPQRIAEAAAEILLGDVCE